MQKNLKLKNQFCTRIENLALCGTIETIIKEFKRHSALLEALNEQACLGNVTVYFIYVNIVCNHHIVNYLIRSSNWFVQ